jgi:hypothetical protein
VLHLHITSKLNTTALGTRHIIENFMPGTRTYARIDINMGYIEKFNKIHDLKLLWHYIL